MSASHRLLVFPIVRLHKDPLNPLGTSAQVLGDWLHFRSRTSHSFHHSYFSASPLEPTTAWAFSDSTPNHAISPSAMEVTVGSIVGILGVVVALPPAVFVIKKYIDRRCARAGKLL